jgi:hypothetical protein
MTVNGVELRVRLGDRTRPSEHGPSIGITSLDQAHRSPRMTEREVLVDCGTPIITRLPPSDIDSKKRPIGNSGALFCSVAISGVGKTPLVAF